MSTSIRPGTVTESVESFESPSLLFADELVGERLETEDGSRNALLHCDVFSLSLLLTNWSFIIAFCKSYNRCWAGVLCVERFAFVILFCLFDAAARRFCLFFAALCFASLGMHSLLLDAIRADDLIFADDTESNFFGMSSKRVCADLCGFGFDFDEWMVFVSLHIAVISSLILAAISSWLAIKAFNRSWAGVFDFFTIRKQKWTKSDYKMRRNVAEKLFSHSNTTLHWNVLTIGRITEMCFTSNSTIRLHEYKFPIEYALNTWK